MTKKRKSRKRIKTTKRADPFMRNVQTAWKGLLRSARTVLVAIGLLWLVIEIAQRLGGG